MRRTLAAALLAAAFISTRAQALENEEMLALVAMPLAVAAVSEVADIPVSDLIDVVTLLNDAAVPPAQFIEVVRYAPVALIVETEQPRFPEFVRVQYEQGLRGTALVNTIEDRFQVYGIHGVDLDVTAPRIVDIDDHFVPRIVQTRLAERRSDIAERRSHPHGGPPGQLKKAIGVQTGAEIVHGTKPGRDHDADRGRGRRVRADDDDRGRAVAKGRDDKPGKGKGKGRGGDHGQGKGKGKGKG